MDLRPTFSRYSERAVVTSSAVGIAGKQLLVQAPQSRQL